MILVSGLVSRPKIAVSLFVLVSKIMVVIFGLGLAPLLLVLTVCS